MKDTVRPHQVRPSQASPPRLLDRLGATGSLLCAIHCALLPLLIALLPSLGIAAWLGEDFERGFVLFASLLGHVHARLGLSPPSRRPRARPADARAGGCCGRRAVSRRCTTRWCRTRSTMTFGGTPGWPGPPGQPAAQPCRAPCTTPPAGIERGRARRIGHRGQPVGNDSVRIAQLRARSRVQHQIRSRNTWARATARRPRASGPPPATATRGRTAAPKATGAKPRRSVKKTATKSAAKAPAKKVVAKKTAAK